MADLVGIRIQEKNLGVRELLQDPLNDLEDAGFCKLPNNPHVLVFHSQHFPGTYRKQLTGAADGSEFANPNLLGVVFVKALSNFGAACTDTQRFLKEMNGRVYVVRHAIHTNEPNALERERFSRFEAAIKQLGRDDRIPWRLLEPPPWPEELVAAYLALVAEERLIQCDAAQTLPAEMWSRAQQQANELMATYGHGNGGSILIDLSNVAAGKAALPDLRKLLHKVSEKRSP